MSDRARSTRQPLREEIRRVFDEFLELRKLLEKARRVREVAISQDRHQQQNNGLLLAAIAVS